MLGWLRKLFNFWPFNIRAKKRAIEQAWAEEFNQRFSIPEAPKNYTNLSHKTISEVKLIELQKEHDAEIERLRNASNVN